MPIAIIFDEILATRSRPGVSRYIRYLGEHLLNRPAIAAVFARQDEWSATKDWYFDKVPLPDLRAMRDALDDMTHNFSSLFPDIKSDGAKHMYLSDLAELRKVLSARIERVERHGTLSPPWPAIVFGPGIYWEAPVRALQVVLEYLRPYQSEHSSLKDVFTDKPIYLEGKRKWFWWVTPDGLRVMKRLIDQMEDELGGNPGRPVSSGQLETLRRSIETRIADLESEAPPSPSGAS